MSALHLLLCYFTEQTFIATFQAGLNSCHYCRGRPSQQAPQPCSDIIRVNISYLVSVWSSVNFVLCGVIDRLLHWSFVCVKHSLLLCVCFLFLGEHRWLSSTWIQKWTWCVCKCVCVRCSLCGGLTWSSTILLLFLKNDDKCIFLASCCSSTSYWSWNWSFDDCCRLLLPQTHHVELLKPNKLLTTLLCNLCEGH